MPISSGAHGNTACKKIIKVGLAAKASKAEGNTARRKSNAVVDSQLSKYNENNDEEEEILKNSEANPIERETTSAVKPTEAQASPTKQTTNHMQQPGRKKTNYGLPVEVAMGEAQEETKEGRIMDDEFDRAFKTEAEAWLEAEMKEHKRWDQALAHEEGKIYKQELQGTDKEAEEEETKRPSKEIKNG
eukprot:6741362-Ditylum_brightwellii.AAC.1